MSATQIMRCECCGAEYRPGFETCVDCGVALTPAKEGASTAESDVAPDWAPFRTLSSESEAVLLQGYLESEGVPCSLESLVFHAEPFTFGPARQGSRARAHRRP